MGRLVNRMRFRDFRDYFERRFAVCRGTDWNVKDDYLSNCAMTHRPHVEAMLGRGRPFNLLFSGPGGCGPGHPEGRTRLSASVVASTKPPSQ